MEFGNPLSASAAGAIIFMLATANAIQWRENRRLNNARVKDMREIIDADHKIVGGISTALNNLRRKIDGINGDKKK